MRKSLGVVLIAFLVLGCQPTQPTKPFYNAADAFNDDDFRWSKESGNGEISGQAFLKTRGGDVKTCAGNPVILIPNNRYTQESSRAAMSGYYGGVTHHAYYYQYRRQAICDASGRFSFKDIPAGSWAVQALVNWEAPTGNGLVSQGGYLYKGINLRGGEKAEVIMTDVDRRPL